MKLTIVHIIFLTSYLMWGILSVPQNIVMDLNNVMNCAMYLDDNNALISFVYRWTSNLKIVELFVLEVFATKGGAPRTLLWTLEICFASFGSRSSWCWLLISLTHSLWGDVFWLHDCGLFPPQLILWNLFQMKIKKSIKYLELDSWFYVAYYDNL